MKSLINNIIHIANHYFDYFKPENCKNIILNNLLIHNNASAFAFHLLLPILGIVIFTSCSNYLDIIPDNVATIEHAFTNRAEAQTYLTGLYWYMPNVGGIDDDPGLTSGDELWLIEPFKSTNFELRRIFQGEQSVTSPICNMWSTRASGATKRGKPLFTGLRDINIFLENIHIPFDLEDYERDRWVAEATFLKAYLHFWLFRMYGPIPLIKTNLPISATPDEVKVYREPVDDVVEYISGLLDECLKGLPDYIEDETSEMGRPTKPIALALKAKVLLLAASPLFNDPDGNSDYADMIDNRGVNLFPMQYSAAKWERAADAIKTAIDAAHEAGHALYDFGTSLYAPFVSDSTILAMQVRGAVTEPWNREIIWGNTNRANTSTLQLHSYPGIVVWHGNAREQCGPPLDIVEQFYTKNGVPIEEDKEWQNINLFDFRKGDENHRYYIEKNYETINLHFDREARFYGSVVFDGMKFYGNGRHLNDKDLYSVYIEAGKQPAGFMTYLSTKTGYLCNKLLNCLTATSSERQCVPYLYSFPIIRLADLYLMYAEALNEVKETPDAEVYEYIDLVRTRTGLKGVVESWEQYSVNPTKPKTQDGMRDIIRREQLIELAFEGQRAWNLRRWKECERYYNRPVRVLNVEASDREFYQVKTAFNPIFEKKDYLWPIRAYDVYTNPNILQNPGW